MTPPDEFDPLVDELDDEDDDAEFLCQLGPDGFCGAAGTEYCEWECPYND